MEPRGCNRWQSAANRLSAERAKQAKTVATGCHQLRAKLHGKQAQTGTMAVQRSGKRVQDFPGERAGRMNVGR